jgi:glycosyltransferase involved in cell wall biosynthesis
MKIAYVAFGSPYDRRSWSGTPYFCLQELRQRFEEVEVIDTPIADKILARSSILARYGILPAREPIVADIFALYMKSRLKQIKPDVIVGVNVQFKLVHCVNNWPCVLFNDHSFGPVVDYYPKYKTLSKRTRRNANAQDQAIVDGPSSLVMSSDWAAESTAEYYHTPLSRLRVAPIGANFDEAPANIQPRDNSGPLKLLFVGFDWHRKGGDIVLPAFRILRTMVPDAELHIVGARPEEADGVDGVIRHGRLNKNDPAQAEILEALFRDSSLFFMPSQAEAYGIVYVEACAYGLPSIAMRTGGVSTIIQSGVNGLLLPEGAEPEAYAHAIRDLWADKNRVAALQSGARTSFEERLTWRVWGDVVEAEVRRLGADRSSQARQ